MGSKISLPKLFEVLCLIEEAAESGAKTNYTERLMRRTCVSSSHLKHTLHLLEEEGMIEREQERKGGRKYITLTPYGKTVAQDVRRLRERLHGGEAECPKTS